MAANQGRRGQHVLGQAVLAGGDDGAPVEIERHVLLEGLAVHQPGDGPISCHCCWLMWVRSTSSTRARLCSQARSMGSGSG